MLSGMATTKAIIGYFVANTVLVILDRNVISRQYGESRYVWFYIVLVPVYLFFRSRATGHNQAPALLWLASIAISIFTPTLLATNVYLGSGTPLCTSPFVTAGIEDTYIELTDMKQLSFEGKVRKCSGTVLGYDGKQYPITYRTGETSKNVYWAID